jgi:putative DNA primase/helicase
LLVILSPEKRCGKTTLLQVLSRLVYRPLFSCNISPSALYRTIQKYSPCLLIDEADSFLSNNEELRGILNAGHTKEDSFVIRTNKDSLEPEIFMTFGPKAIASIGKVPDTLIDRSIKIYLKRKRLEEKVKKLGSANSFTDLKRKIFKWIIDCKDKLENTNPEVPEEVSNDRGIDNWFPLLAIADAIGGEWPKKIREAMFDLEVGTFQELTLNQILLEDIREIFTDRERISSKDLVEELLKMEDRPWPEYKRGRPLTINQLARLLKPYGISPKTIRMSPEKTAKGFLKMDFEDMFRRYLPPLINESEKKSVYTPFQSVTTSQSNDFEDLAQFRNVTSSVNVTDQKLSNLLKLKECYGVTDPKGGKSVDFRAEGEKPGEIDLTGVEVEW